MKRKKNSKRKKNRVLKTILLIILLGIIAAAGWFAYKTHKNGGGISGVIKTAVGYDENTKKELKEIKILLLGVSTDLDAQLTDTIMVVSYNPNTQKANLLSIPRDTYTGKNQATATAAQKINAIYNMTRKPEKTLKAVNDLTGLDIEYYAIVRTEGLIKLVDAIGGVEFNVPIDMYYTDKTQNLVIDLKAGVQKLNGDKAEQLLRFRHNNNGTSYPVEYGDNDLGRMRTQREFITETLKQTLRIGNIFKIGQIIDVINENIETNISLALMKDYLPYIVEFSTENLRTAVLPGTTPDMKATNNVSIFVMNKTQAKELIDSMFNETENVTEAQENTISNTTVSNTTTSTPKIKVELLDGTGNKTKLEKAKELLEKAGYTVTKTGSTTQISKTIITNKKSVTEENLNEIKKTLGVGNISTNKSTTSSVDVTIIIGKDF